MAVAAKSQECRALDYPLRPSPRWGNRFRKKIEMNQKILVVYHYFEKDRSYIENFLHFLTFGYSRSLNYLVVVAGSHTIALPQLENLSYVFTENRNNDFGGYSYAVRTFPQIHSYDFFIFVNSSVRGPYVPPYTNKCWAEYFTEMLQGDVGLAGSTINILPSTSPNSISYKEKYGEHEPFAHVQSMCYAMPKQSLLFLREAGFFDVDETLTKDEVIRDYEIRLSRKIVGNGWNIKCLLPEYNVIDYRDLHPDVNPTSGNGDPSFKSAYFGRTPHPFEVIFVKTHRDMFSMRYLERLSYSAYKNRTLDSGLLASPAIADFIRSLDIVAKSKAQVLFDTPRSCLRAAVLAVLPKALRVFARKVRNLLFS